MRAETAAVPDHALAQALLLRGDEQAFRELYARHTPRLYALVLRIMGGAEHDAEDVVQETWIRATESLGAFRWEAAFGTWLTGIGINVARGLLRKQGRWTTLDEGAEPWRPAPAHGPRGAPRRRRKAAGRDRDRRDPTGRRAAGPSPRGFGSALPRPSSATRPEGEWGSSCASTISRRHTRGCARNARTARGNP